MLSLFSLSSVPIITLVYLSTFLILNLIVPTLAVPFQVKNVKTMSVIWLMKKKGRIFQLIKQFSPF